MIHFIIGTRAQLFKMAPIMIECEKRNLQWRWVYAAQHQETMSQTLKTFGIPGPDYTVVKWNTEAKTMGKMWAWFLRMLISLPRSKTILNGYTGKNHIVLTHGDTLTTWLGALIGKLTRTKVMHVESGLRSFNIWKPFPEEINRLITFRLSDYFVAPGNWALKNLTKYRGTKLNTKMNTQVDTIKFGLENCDNAKVSLPKSKYVVASIHRYENIFKKDRLIEIIERIEEIAEKYTVLFVQHPATFVQLDELKLRNRLSKNKNITLLPRLEYLPFVKTVKHSEFVITDGGGNQEELYYMGKPTLVFRNETERQEGLGKTAVISKLDKKIINEFISNYKKYQQKPVFPKVSPSTLIVKKLEEDGFGG